MRTRANPILLCLAAATAVWGAQGPEDKAVAYLAEEVRRWSIDNHCFSCHNNGDGARALLIARKLGRSVPPESLQQTMDWLKRPADWQGAANNPGVSDKVLAAIQFAAAASESMNHDAIRQAARLIVASQKPDGSWPIDQGSIGSPATYGTSLATGMATRTLELADDQELAKPIQLALEFLSKQKPQSVPDAVAATLAGAGDHTAVLLRWQHNDGGWGPWAQAPSEPFDTALVLLALQRQPKAKSAIALGRKYLVRAQLPSGGWEATTRPPGGQSYAQHISTTAWVTIALLRTHPE